MPRPLTEAQYARIFEVFDTTSGRSERIAAVRRIIGGTAAGRDLSPIQRTGAAADAERYWQSLRRSQGHAAKRGEAFLRAGESISATGRLSAPRGERGAGRRVSPSARPRNIPVPPRSLGGGVTSVRVQTQAVDASGNPIADRYVSKVFTVGPDEPSLEDQVREWIESGTPYEAGSGGRQSPSPGVGGPTSKGRTSDGNEYTVLSITEGRYVSP